MNSGNMPPKNGGGSYQRYNTETYGEPEVRRKYSPEEAGHESRRRPVSRTRHRRRTPPNPGVVLLIVIFAVIIGVCVFFIASGRSTPPPAADSAVTYASGESEGEGASAVTTDDGLDYYTIEVPQEQLYYGDLILVNFAHEYHFPAEAESSIVTISSLKNSHYYLSTYSNQLLKSTIEQFNTLTDAYFAATGFQSLQVNSAYRSFQDQTDLYNEYSETKGADYAKAYVATPGYSEHHTGLALDLNVYMENDGIYYIESYPACQWFRENCEIYGFILRYPEEKQAMTAINYESWHYRYVGVPHAQIMEQMNYCLEEYTDYLRAFTYDGTRLLYNEGTGASPLHAGETADSGVLIYYTPAASSGNTEVKIPKDAAYSLSGNNIDGFVVTATLGAE